MTIKEVSQKYNISLVICMRSAGLPVEALIEYVELYQQGDQTFGARLELLQEQRRNLEEQQKQLQAAMNKLDYKISRYEVAVKTGKLSWEENSCT